MMLPRDPFILFSYVNTRLRDQYDSLDALCEDLDVDETELTETLASAGYSYDADQNRFR